MPSKTVPEWVDALQASGRYSFLRAEAVSATGLDAESVKKALQRLVRRRRLAKVKDYFYVVVPLEYLAAGCPPASWFIDALMAAMSHPYYVGLLSAAGLHGASHQQPQEFQVVTDGSIRSLVAGRVRIRFFAKSQFSRTPIVNMKTPTGSMRVSSPEATVVDLVRYAKSVGHLGNIATVLSELAQDLDPRKLADVAVGAGDLPTAQRLGWLLDHVRARRIADPLARKIEHRPVRPVLLRPGRPAPSSRENPRWHVIVNEAIESEA